METTIKVKIEELTPALLNKIKALFKNEKELEITVSPVADFGLTKKESREEYVARIKKAISNIKSGRNTVSFSEEEFDNLTSDLLDTK